MTQEQLEKKVVSQKNRIAKIKLKVKELEERERKYQKELISMESKITSYKKAIENILVSVIKIEYLSTASNPKTSELHRYAAATCEDVLAEVRKLK